MSPAVIAERQAQELAARSGLPQPAVAGLHKVFSGEPRIQQVVLYGSRARGGYRTGSDIDLCVFAPQLNLSGLWALENRMDDLLLPWKIDLTLAHTLDDPALRARIESEGVVFYSPQQQ